VGDDLPVAVGGAAREKEVQHPTDDGEQPFHGSDGNAREGWDEKLERCRLESRQDRKSFKLSLSGWFWLEVSGDV
jgi:hypothetical protein